MPAFEVVVTISIRLGCDWSALIDLPRLRLGGFDIGNPSPSPTKGTM